MSDLKKIIVLAFTSKNQQKQQQFREMVEESDILRNRIDLTIVSSEEEALAYLSGAEVYLCYRFPSDWLPKAENLKWIHAGAAGVNHILTPELVRSSLRITNARGIHVDVQSDYIIGAMITWSRKLLYAERMRADRQWRDWKSPMIVGSFALKNQVLLIVGLGAIGKTLAKKAFCLGMIVHGIKRQIHPDEYFPDVVKMWNPKHLDEALGQADFVTSLVPYTTETHHMFGEAEFRRMKSSAFFVNTSRGKVVDEAALVAALRENVIAGAALDVFEEEPLPEESPLWDLENVILTPHIGGNYERYTLDVYEQFVANLERYVRGDSLFNEVDKQLGY
jgi:phosphoglycerate dehydrogenase-like enzyme